MTSLNLVCRGDIARALGQSVTTVGHVLNTRPHIVPIGRAGICRLYSEHVIEQVRIELDKRSPSSAEQT
ncbi:MAG: hypothetical protein V3T84_00920 [Phycisphaerales bacterium]